ncbi:MAG: acyl carrier protein [bacterium]
MSRKNVENLEQEIRTMIAEIAERDEEEIGSDIDFVKDLGFDSMTALEILAKLEKKYRIRITEKELTKLNNLQQTVDLVKNLLSSKE